MPGRLIHFVRTTSSSSTSSPDSPNTSPPALKPRGVAAAAAAAVDTMDHLKRTHLSANSPASKPDKRADKSPALRATGAKPLATTLDLQVESPPNFFYGNTQTSTGALFSGLLRMAVPPTGVTLDIFQMRLVAIIKAKRPVAAGCADCEEKSTELFKWMFIREPKTLPAGTHTFPFSYLLPGHLPASTFGHLGVLEYYLCAKAVTRTGENVILRRPLPLYRALPPLPEKNSLRIFPPTNITAHVSLSPVVHPIGDFPVLMRLVGVTDNRQKDVQTRWRLRKLAWRVEETEKMISPACARHAHKVGGVGKGMAHEEVRVLGHGELKEGWKTDFADGSIELEFKARSMASADERPLCDVESPTGLAVTHALVVELVVAEEWAPTKRPNQATPTGAARVLRMQFQLVITERSGMGISWDEEQPPTYDDVPDSPPLYQSASRVGSYDGPLPPLDDMERLRLDAPAAAQNGPGASAAAMLRRP